MGAVGKVTRRRGAALAALGTLGAAALVLLLTVGGHRPIDRSAPTAGAAVETAARNARPSAAAVPVARHAGAVGRPAPARDRLPIVAPSAVAAIGAVGWAAALVMAGAVPAGRRPAGRVRSRAPPVALV